MLVPTVLRQATEATWWAPRFLRRRPPPGDRYKIDPLYLLRLLVTVL